MRAKMKDIASALGVSLVTVSKAIRNHPDISKATRLRVEEKVKELNYRPNAAARSLITGRSSLIGFIVPDLIHPFFAEVAKGVSLVLRERGYFLVMSSSEEDPSLERQEIDHMLAYGLDAMIVASCAPDASSLNEVQAGDTPLILVDRSFQGFSSHFVGSDDYTAGKLATEHLLAIGCTRIAHVRGPENSTGKRRLKGFRDAMTKHGRPMPPEYIIEARSVDVDGITHGAAALRTLSSLATPPDGIFCYNDPIATGVIMEACKQGLRIPEDLAVIGCGNLHSDETLRVPLSSIDQRSREIGTRAAAMVLELLVQDAPQDHKKVVLQPKLAPRDSTMLRMNKA